jgi:hypothetical protein
VLEGAEDVVDAGLRPLLGPIGELDVELYLLPLNAGVS